MSGRQPMRRERGTKGTTDLSDIVKEMQLKSINNPLQKAVLCGLMGRGPKGRNFRYTIKDNIIILESLRMSVLAHTETCFEDPRVDLISLSGYHLVHRSQQTSWRRSRIPNRSGFLIR